MIDEQEIRYRYTTEMALVILVGAVYFRRKPGSDISKFVLDYQIDWSLFDQIITAHQIRPFVFKVLAAYPENIDAALLGRLRNVCFQIATGNMRKLEEMVRLQAMLQAGGVPNVPYKGVILSQLLFGDYISRETSDIDFLIDPQYFRQAHELLLANGYKPRFYNPDFERQFLRSSHELLYRKNYPSGAIKIEIHWAATSRMMRIPLPNSELFRDVSPLTLPGGSVGAFSLRSHLLLLLVHHSVNDVWRSLRHVADIALIVNRLHDQIDWVELRAAAERYNILHASQIGLKLAHELFGTPVPMPFQTATPLPDVILDNLLHFPALKKRKLNFDNLQQQLLLRDTFGHKVALLAAYAHAALTPNIRDMEANKLPKGLYALYYLIKPFRMLFGREPHK